jgi:HD-GYP domain-containing protein (c-di-GMP phosphodiesterase class II)
MRLVPTSAVSDQAQLARDVLVGRADGIPLLRAGTKITQRYREGLERAGIHAIYVEDELSEGIVPEELVSAETRTLASKAVGTAYQSAKETIVCGQPLEERTISALGAIVERILQEIEASGGTALALADLCAADSYTFQHSVDVTALGLLLGRQILHERGWLDYRGVRRYTRFDERLYELGLGLLLHDIGKLAIPMELLHKPGKLTPTEWEIMKTHPRAGLELLRGSMCSPLSKSIVLRHHERWDGSGYPDGKRGMAIHEMARIAAVADVYDAVTSERPYDTARPAHVGVRIILDGSNTSFDPVVVDAFSRLVAPFPPGVELELADGRRAIVVSVPDEELDRPVVRVIDDPRAPYEISLLYDRSVDIAGWKPTVATAAV